MAGLAHATEAPATGAAPPVQRVQRHHGPERAFDDRIKLLTRELDLSDEQQAAVRVILQRQREQVAKIWSDSAIPAAYRVSATRAANDKTGDAIRALLNDAQRKKFSLARQSHEPAAGSSNRTVEQWMDAAKAK